MKRSVLLDTSFFLRLLNDEEPLYKNAIDYYKYFANNGFIMKISTISIAEYCVVGKIFELPLKAMQVVPFNIDHAERTGEFANIIFQENRIQINILMR
jgi:predicted nucleic acid-binding protein